ncbi:MAG: AAA family ATPase [Betaproteobacteria bacterium]|nr:AAA family ATPase [Betaproteobacteria bacterium]
MKLQAVTMKNFMPFKGVVRVDFPQDEFRNVMLVFGDNMLGKTSILNAIRWGFYGTAIARHSRTIPSHDLLNKEAASEGDWTFEVHIDFEANGTQYDLRRRTEKRASIALPTRADDFQTQVLLRKDGIPVQGDLVEAEINAVSPEQVSRFFLFDGELLQEYEALLIENSDQGRQIKEAIEQVLGVPALIYGRDQLAALSKSAQKAQQSDLQRVQGLERLAQQQAELTSKQESFDKDLTGLQQKLTNLRKERASLDDDIEATHAVYAEKGRLDTLELQRKQIETYQTKKTAERLDLFGNAWRDLIEAKVAVRLAQMESTRLAIIERMRARVGIETRIAQLRQLLATKICPTCKIDLVETRHVEIGTELGVLEGTLEGLEESDGQLQSIAAQIGVLSKIRGVNARDRIAQIDNDLQGYEIDLTRIENEAAQLKDKLAGYDTAEIARKIALRDMKVAEEGRLQGDVVVRKGDIEKVKNEIAMAQRTIDGLAQTRNNRSRLKASTCSQLEAVFGASIERLRDRLRKRVEERANEAFREMTTRKSYSGLAINDNYGLTIVDDLGGRVTIRSAGAEQVVALSLIDGLNRTGRAAGPVIMDTPFGRLDLKHRDNILTYLPKVCSQFVLLVHSGEIRREIDLEAIAPRIGAVYELREISARHSALERTAL